MRNDPSRRSLSSLAERVPLLRGRPVVALALTVGLCAAGLFIRWAADSLLPPGFPYVTFFPAVILASFLFGARLGLVAGALCGLAAWYWFIPPAGFGFGPGTGTALAFYAFVVATDLLLVHWMQRANADLAAERERSARLAETRELLFRELQHRVSNNLQVAAALLSLQRRKVPEPEARAALDEASRRLALIGRISRQLYDAGGGTRSLRAFLEPLCHDVIDAAGRPGVTLSVHADADIALASEQAVPLALIVAEAISNSVEHGFDGRAGGRLDVTLRRAADGTAVEIRDDGRGLPPGFALDGSDSLGLRIATTLASQLGGRFTLEPASPGSVARLTLPA